MQRTPMERTLNRRELVKAAAGTTLAATLGHAIAAQAAQNSMPHEPGVDMSHECTVADPSTTTWNLKTNMCA